MATHPYISGPKNISQIIALLRKNFPASVTSETVKKYGLASNNESYVINALQFVGVIDADGKRTSQGSEVFALHDEKKFQSAFEKLVKTAYKDLFDLHGDGAWSLSRSDLIGYFRTTDKTSDVIGTRQASVFQVFAAASGHEEADVAPRAMAKPKAKPAVKAVPASKSNTNSKPKVEVQDKVITPRGGRETALTVRIEINLPAGGTRETYDHIFKSIKANLINE